jgi:glyoxylase-like metal-dependent hydrolase (beta-lactamase superfamily II)
MQAGGYDIDILVQGFPGKAVCHGGLGWSTIVLLRGRDRIGLIDVGSFGIRRPLIQRLGERGLKPADVTDVMLTHSHHDHAVNWTLFRRSRIVIGATELDWAVKEPWGETPVAELYMQELRRWRTLSAAGDGDEVFPGLKAHVLPGHTPGHLVYVLRGETHDMVFTGDAAKNRAELLSRKADLTYDPALSSASIERIWDLWRRRPGSILVPGHDLPMLEDGGHIRYLGKREAAISAWFGDDLETTTLFALTVA